MSMQDQDNSNEQSHGSPNGENKDINAKGNEDR